MKSMISNHIPAPLCLLCLLLSLCTATTLADTLYMNARVHTVDDRLPWADEFTVAGQKITCVGKSGECAPLASSTIDMRRQFIMPGFIDSHNHIRYAMGSRFLSVADAGSLQEFRAAIEAHALEHPELEWIEGDGWNYSIFENGMPTFRDLEGLAGGRPIILTSYDAHTQLLNQAAMDAFEITRDTRKTPLGTISRDSTGEPTGIFKAAIYISEEDLAALYEVLPEPDTEDMYQSFLGNLQEATASGITTIVEPQVYPEDIEFFERARRDEKLNAHIHLALFHPPGTSAETLAHYRDIRKQYKDDQQIHVPALKLYIDDVIESESAALFEPYAGTENRGELFYEPETFDELITRLDAEQFQLFIHAIGDRGVHTALDALEKARKDNGASELPHQLVHIELLQAADIDRFSENNISAVVQPRHMSPDISLQWAKSIGQERLGNAWPFKSMLDAGARLAFSSDWNVAEMNPMYGIFSAVNRTGLGGNPQGGWQPQEKISVEAAIYGYTMGGAISNGMEQERGSISTGKFADFVVLDRNPYEVEPTELKDIEVLQTFFQGRSVFDAAAR